MPSTFGFEGAVDSRGRPIRPAARSFVPDLSGMDFDPRGEQDDDEDDSFDPREAADYMRQPAARPSAPGPRMGPNAGPQLPTRSYTNADLEATRPRAPQPAGLPETAADFSDVRAGASSTAPGVKIRFRDHQGNENEVPFNAPAQVMAPGTTERPEPEFRPSIIGRGWNSDGSLASLEADTRAIGMLNQKWDAIEAHQQRSEDRGRKMQAEDVEFALNQAKAADPYGLAVVREKEKLDAARQAAKQGAKDEEKERRDASEMAKVTNAYHAEMAKIMADKATLPAEKEAKKAQARETAERELRRIHETGYASNLPAEAE